MKLVIRLPAGYKKEIDCQPNTLIRTIKEEVASQTAIDQVQLTIVYEGRKLDDSATVEASNLKEGVVITVMVIPSA